MNDEERNEIRKIAREELSVGLGERGEALNRAMDKFREELKLAKSDLEGTTREIFENAGFVKNFKTELMRFVEQEVSFALSKYNLQDIIKNKIKQAIKDDLQGMIVIVVKEVVRQTNSKLKEEYRVAKKLSYSIDSEIKHILMKTPISATDTDMIKRKIMGILKSSTVKSKKILQITKK